LRLESTMQSRIRVYESGRTEQVSYDPSTENIHLSLSVVMVSIMHLLFFIQDYDPDLPPELAAATGHPETPVDNHNKTDNGHADFNVQGRGPANLRAPVVQSSLL
jgi:hypothetical protein